MYTIGLKEIKIWFYSNDLTISQRSSHYLTTQSLVIFLDFSLASSRDGDCFDAKTLTSCFPRASLSPNSVSNFLYCKFENKFFQGLYFITSLRLKLVRDNSNIT